MKTYEITKEEIKDMHPVAEGYKAVSITRRYLRL